jgi:hypothetical protein
LLIKNRGDFLKQKVIDDKKMQAADAQHGKNQDKNL